MFTLLDPSRGRERGFFPGRQQLHTVSRDGSLHALQGQRISNRRRKTWGLQILALGGSLQGRHFNLNR